uniref:hypothetical protein n=1 Tax=Rheinheimera sp. TaxID=1869214 RepID=UPI004048B317
MSSPVSFKTAINKWSRKISSRRLRGQRLGGPIYTGTRKNPKHSRRRTEYYDVVAPAALDLSKLKSHTKTVDFVQNLREAVRRAAQREGTVKLCFRDTKLITASGGIYLLATTDVLVKQYPTAKFSISWPPAIPHSEFHAAKSVVHSVLRQIGFYSLINVKAHKGEVLPHVDCWHVETATKVESEKLGEAITRLIPYGIRTSALYRSGIEAMSNASEHAYSTNVPSKRIFLEKRWWLFTAVLNHELIVYICDLGHGIPETLPYTQDKSVLDKVYLRLKELVPNYVKNRIGVFEGDALQIQASTLIKKTRTELNYRGKGGQDIKSFIDTNPNARLHIYSNKGFLRYKNKQSSGGSSELGIGYNNKHSINGTIVGWSVPIGI